MKNTLVLIFFTLLSQFIQGQKILGDWYGSLNIQGTELPLVFHIKKQDSTYSSTMDSPKQMAVGLAVAKTTFKNSQLTLEAPAMGIKYTGDFNPKEDSIKGTFQQGGLRLALNLSRNNIIQNIKRPQEPKEPFSYHSEEITFYNKHDDITLAGTLTTPEDLKKFPVVILISGSGPQNRDEEIMDHKPFLVLSDYLTRHGIAVLRYDDRGVAESEGEYASATSEDLSRDTKAAIKYLQSRKDIKISKLGLIGHSEGGIIAPLVASKSNEVDFIVLLAGSVIKGKELLLLQKKLIEEKSGISDSIVNRSQEIFQGAYNIIASNSDTDGTLKDELERYFKEETNNSMNASQMNKLIENMTSPWMKYFISYDPSTVLKDINIPTLALFGKKDVQVPALENSIALEKLKNRKIEIIQMDNLNHLFQESETGMPNEYFEIEQTMSPKVMNLISEWILAKE
ncbi:alpha/beta hydrolase [Zunongwangia sp. SCSIO 43204]|uniref:alpha/beta hydrolase family protein n=1 Tax=Zunongwangia sp. SCSIO 43204 TaxID=2779359 RepID=UPI001CA9214E|nr:alpha/beta hydrolase [Zunongwangia sp. SCSIO 43204]UAB82818.1 alpha/beta hydrolase [Zunongwangia sp. SCSIO 43204]